MQNYLAAGLLTRGNHREMTNRKGWGNRHCEFRYYIFYCLRWQQVSSSN